MSTVYTMTRTPAMTLNDLKLRARALLRPSRVEQELEEELAFHIEREARKLIDEGITPTEARARAQARFGSTTLAADRCRDERGTAVIDNTIRDVQYALRAFAKAPLAAFTIVVTVAIGLGVVAVLFTVLNTLIFRVDQVPDIGEMYAVERTPSASGDGSLLTRPIFEAMRADTQVFRDAYADRARHRSSCRRPEDGGHARHREFLPGRSGQSGPGTRPHAGR